MSALYQFLQRNNITKANPLPLVHTTDSYFVKKIISSGKITPRPCNVFSGENLSYFFVGRAAYKKESGYDAEYWELPSCLVFEYFSSGVKRIFPFDSGAFSNKLYPNFIGMMDIEDYEVSIDNNSPEKLIGTFFSTPDNYYRLRSRNEDWFKSEFDIDVLDEEILALHKLIGHKDNKSDDRRFAIEMQFNKELKLSEKKLICAIVPETYLSNENYIESIESTGAKIITYPLYPLRKKYYYFTIYEKLDQFYKSEGYYGV